MSTIVKFNAHTKAAKSFYYDVVTSGNSSLYLGIGRNTAWADDANPPVPVDTKQEETDFWDNLIGIQRVQANDVQLMVPRYDWAAGLTDFVVFDVNDPNAYNTKFYCKNSNNDVYELIAKTNATDATVTEPVGTGQNISTGDGHTWKYLYSISASDATNLMTVSWMPVSDHNFANKLGARYLVLRAVITDTSLPVDVQYRQIGAITNPLDSAGNPVVADSEVQANLQLYSGTVMYIENRTPISRLSGQSETLLIILQF